MSASMLTSIVENFNNRKARCLDRHDMLINDYAEWRVWKNVRNAIESCRITCVEQGRVAACAVSGTHDHVAASLLDAASEPFDLGDNALISELGAGRYELTW